MTAVKPPIQSKIKAAEISLHNNGRKFWLPMAISAQIKHKLSPFFSIVIRNPLQYDPKDNESNQISSNLNIGKVHSSSP